MTKAVTWTEVCRWPQGPTPAELAASAEEMRKRSLEDEARKRVVREDRQLLTKHPDAARHRRAHLDELAEVSRKMRVPTARFWTLMEERKPLDVQAAFYVGKPMPPDLKRRIDASEAAFAALVDVFGDLQLELAQVDARFANERDRLGRLWSGAPLGSMGPLPVAATPPLSR